MRRAIAFMICLTSVPALAQQPTPGERSNSLPIEFYGGGNGDGTIPRPSAGSGGNGASNDGPTVKKSKPKLPENPFNPPKNPGMGGMGGMAGMGDMMGGMEGFDGMSGMMGGGDEMGGMDMGMGMGMGMGPSSNPEQAFRRGLQLAIRGLRQAKSEEHRTALKGYIKSALEERYARMIKKRRKDLERLKAQIAQLEQDLSRRESAAKRVIEVQMQSVELASEGLLELGELRGAGASPGGMGSGMGEEMEMGGLGGMMGAGN